MGRRPGAGAWTWWLAAFVLAAPLLVFIAALGTRTGQWSYAVGHDLLTLRVGVVLAALGGGAALVLLASALRRRTSLKLAATAVAVCVATIGLYVWQIDRVGSGPPDDITTDLSETPGLGALDDRRGGPSTSGRGGPEQCPGAQPAMTQVAPESAVWALQQAGFSLQGGVSVGRAAGSQRGFWFGTVHDAVIRIRPGRTDVRVAARDGRRHGGEACRLATRISAALRSG